MKTTKKYKNLAPGGVIPNALWSYAKNTNFGTKRKK
jgi:hypothetical protein